MSTTSLGPNAAGFIDRPGGRGFSPEFQEQVVRKAYRRLTWFLFVLQAVAYMDRINLGFAALSMNKDLHLTATTYAFANMLFTIGYLLFDIPSTMLLDRYGARRWIARIMITWGLATSLTMLATGAQNLAIFRFILGAAEGGLNPGVMLYLTFWFPGAYAARARALFFVAMPVTAAVASSISGYLLQMNGVWGFRGWQWLFLLEGLPAVIVGIIVLGFLTDKPEKARWLTDQEKQCLRQTLDAEEGPQREASKTKLATVLRDLMHPGMLLLGWMQWCQIMSANLLVFWLPQIMRAVHVSGSYSMIGWLTALPSACAAVVMVLWSRHSDRTQERKWHITIVMFMAGVGWILASRSNPSSALLGAILAACGGFTAYSITWTVPARFLRKESRAVGMGFLSSCGIAASLMTHLIMGLLKDWTGSFAAGLTILGIIVATGGVASMLLPMGKSAAPAPAPTPGD